MGSDQGHAGAALTVSANGDGRRAGLRVGVDVGGTFTKAVAVEADHLRLRAQRVVPTTHSHPSGVTAGVVEALEGLLSEIGPESERIDLVAFSTTQAMNALLEGDVARIGVVGIGRAPDLRVARRRTRVGEIALAPGRSLRTEHEFLDASNGISERAVDGALDRLQGLSCEAVAISGAFAVDSPADERRVAARAARRGLPSCMGNELSGAYGLETRTVSAAINASILPVVERTAGLVEKALAEAGIDVPLLVLRGDGGAMSIEAFRRRPSFTVGSGPAAGVAAALHELGISDGIVIECGGTSSNVSVVRGGRPVLRTVRVMGRPTAIRSIDSWVVGAGGGSMARVARRRLAETGPRSAHIARLPYAAFAAPEELAGGELELVAPAPGDPDGYAVVRAGGRRYALTATCAANALGLVDRGAYAHGSREAAMAAFAALAPRLRGRDPERAARKLLDGAIEKVANAVSEAVAHHEVPPHAPLVSLGGAAEVLVPEVARLLDREVHRPEHPEVLSSIGAAVSLLRAEVSRSVAGVRRDGHAATAEQRLALTHDAERACVESGAAPTTVSVELTYDRAESQLRAVATGAAALESGAAVRRPVDASAQLRVAAGTLGVAPERLSIVAGNEFYRVYSENGSGRVAVIDRLGGVVLAERARRILSGENHELLSQLREAVQAVTVNLGLAQVLPRVSVLCGTRMLDLSDARTVEDILAAAQHAVADHSGTAVAVIAR